MVVMVVMVVEVMVVEVMEVMVVMVEALIIVLVIQIIIHHTEVTIMVVTFGMPDKNKIQICLLFFFHHCSL
jgi:hypothetical protein